MHFDIANLSSRTRYKLLTGAVVPRPIAWVSTVNEGGQPNLAPFSYYIAVCQDPFVLAFCPGIRAVNEAEKDTLRNIRAIGQFVINAVTEEMVEAMNITATELPPEVNEFERAGLTPAPSVCVAPPRVGESKVSFECNLVDIVEFGKHVGSGSLVLGEAVHVHLQDEIVYDGDKIDLFKYKPVGRLAGSAYCRVTDIFELVRPAPEIQDPASLATVEIWQDSAGNDTGVGDST